MATADELRCMATLCANLDLAAGELSGPRAALSTEEEAGELLELLPQVLEAAPHPGRIEALLYRVQPPPIDTAVRLMDPHVVMQSSKLRTLATKVLTRILATCLGPNSVDSLAPRLRETLRDVHIIQLLLRTISEGPPATEGAAAAELLFLLVMQLPSLRDDLVNEFDGVRQLLIRLADEGEPTFTSFVAVTLRVLVQCHHASFAAPSASFFPIVSHVLLRGQGNLLQPQSVVLIIQTLSELLHHSPSAYVSQVLGNTEMLDEMTEAVVTHLTLSADGNEPPEVAEDLREVNDAVSVALKGMMSVEGSSVEIDAVISGRHGVRSVFLQPAAWLRAMTRDNLSEEAQLLILQLQRWLVETAVARPHALLLCSPFMEVFPRLCALLNDSTIPTPILTESAILLALCCSKCVRIRQQIAALVEGYEPWAARLYSTVAACLRHAASTGALDQIYIVDEFQNILNDPDILLSRPDGHHVGEVANVARALYAEQERRERMASGDTVILGPLHRDLHVSSPLRLEGTSMLAQALLERAVALSLTRTAVEQIGVASHVDLSTVAVHLAAGSQRQVAAAHTPQHNKASPSVALGSPATARAAHRATASSSSSALDHSFIAIAATPKTPRPMTPTRAASSGQNRVTKATKLFATPQRKAPFRPSSGSSSFAAAGGIANPLAVHGQQQHRLLVEALEVDGGGGDEYLSVAIMMHLAITFGPHYNRQNRGAVRRLVAPTGDAYVQPVKRNTSHSWTILDVREGDLYVLFVPFHKLTVDRIDAEIAAVERYLVNTKKQLVLTPQQQRSRRWLLHDMLNYVLPKTELLLRDLNQLLRQFGADNVVYQLGVIRLLDEGRREQQDMLLTALEDVDVAMPNELLRLSSGRLKDVLHSGNLSYAVRKLKDVLETAASSASAALAGPALPQLASIEQEIQRLERRSLQEQQQSGKNAAGAGGGGDTDEDIEVAYARELRVDEKMQRDIDDAAERLLNPQRYASPAVGAVVENERESEPPDAEATPSRPKGTAPSPHATHINETLPWTLADMPTLAAFEDMYRTVEQQQQR